MDGTNVERQPVLPKTEAMNHLSKAMQTELWKSTREFTKAEPIIAEWRAASKVPKDHHSGVRDLGHELHSSQRLTTFAGGQRPLDEGAPTRD